MTSGLLEFLNSPANDIRDVNSPLITHGDAAWIDELTVACTGASPGPKQSPFPVELLDPITVVPHDVYIVLVINRDTGLAFGLNGARARVPPCSQEMSGVIEYLNATIVGIPDDHFIVPVRGDTARIHERRVTSALTPPLQEEVTVAVEFLDAVIPGITDVNHAPSVNRHSGREVELPVAGAIAPPLNQEASVAVECLDAVVVIRDVDRSSFVNCDTARNWPADPEDELSVTIADLAPHREELTAMVELLHALMVGINDIDIPLPIRCERRGITQIVVNA